MLKRFLSNNHEVIIDYNRISTKRMTKKGSMLIVIVKIITAFIEFEFIMSE